ncbi:MAG TPA: hypothetical protein VF062_04700 [Candidatus Limnocylindrales bacterium]
MSEQPPYNPPPPAQPPPVQPYGQPAPRDNTQLFGILGIVLAVICCGPLGILFGYLSIREAKKHGKDQTLGKVGFWLGIVLTALGLIAAILGICFGAFGSWTWNNDTNDPYDY